MFKECIMTVPADGESFNLGLSITRMVGLSAFVSPDKSVITPMSITINYTHLLNFCTVSNPAAKTRSMGLPSDALLSWFLHRHLPTSAPGAIRAVYRDSVIWTILS
jgi:hypothetical protein